MMRVFVDGDAIMRWVTDKIVKLLREPPVRISTVGAGGDYDTNNIVLSINAETLFVCGFTTKTAIVNENDCDVEYVEVSDGQDSRGGLNSRNKSFCVLYANVVSKLRKEGFEVVPNMEDYF